MSGDNKYKYQGFTIVELLVVLSIIALLLSIITPRYLNKIEEGKEIVLKQNLSTIRRSIDQYYSDQGIYPMKLSDLVDKRYLREIPLDPITKSQDWIIIKDKNIEGIYDIESNSKKDQSNNRIYSIW